MSKKLLMKWTKPPPKNLDSAMEVIDFNIIFHKKDEAEVTKIYQYRNLQAKTLLGGLKAK